MSPVGKTTVTDQRYPNQVSSSVRQRGATLIGLVLSLAISMALLGVFLSGYKVYRDQAEVQAAAQEVIEISARATDAYAYQKTYTGMQSRQEGLLPSHMATCGIDSVRLTPGWCAKTIPDNSVAAATHGGIAIIVSVPGHACALFVTSAAPNFDVVSIEEAGSVKNAYASASLQNLDREKLATACDYTDHREIRLFSGKPVGERTNPGFFIG